MMIFVQHIPKLMVLVINLFDLCLEIKILIYKKYNVKFYLPFPALNGRSSPDILYGFDQPFNKLLLVLKCLFCKVSQQGIKS